MEINDEKITEPDNGTETEKISQSRQPTLLTRFFAWQKKRRLQKEEKQKKKNPVLRQIVEWGKAILWALIIVILIQQFIFELYLIPTGSMLPNVEIGSRVAVEKITFGPEIIPGKIKLNGIRLPRRGEIVMFENPSYPPMNPLINILHKIIYRLTLTLVDIDKDQFGNPRPRLLLKRVIAIPGDRIRTRRGNMEIMPAGTNKWLTEEELKKQLGLTYTIQRDARYLARNLQRENDTTSGEQPDDAWLPGEQEWYIPENTFFPMGDNRDHSRDAREYGPVPTKRLLGKAFFRFWPLNKFGFIK